MTYDPDNHHRRSIRLAGYDYTQAGGYHVTIVTAGRECLFGEVVDGEVRLNWEGQVARREWARLARRFPHVQLDAFVVMPNHIHGIIIITGDGCRGTASPTDNLTADGSAVPLRELPAARQDERFGKPVPGSIPTIVRSYKSAVTLRINAGRGALVWQRNFYEHIVRNDESLDRIRQYIIDNPTRWDDDDENPGKRAR